MFLDSHRCLLLRLKFCLNRLKLFKTGHGTILQLRVDLTFTLIFMRDFFPFERQSRVFPAKVDSLHFLVLGDSNEFFETTKNFLGQLKKAQLRIGFDHELLVQLLCLQFSDVILREFVVLGNQTFKQHFHF